MSEFFNMGGSAAYVWSAYGISLVVLVLNLILPFRREQALLHGIKKKLQREANQHESETA